MNTTKTRTTVRNVPALRANIRTMRRDLHDVTALRETLSRAMLLTKKEADELAASLGPSFTTVNILGGTIVCSHYLRHEVLWMLRTASRSYSRIMEPIWREIHDARQASQPRRRTCQRHDRREVRHHRWRPVRGHTAPRQQRPLNSTHQEQTT